MLVAAVLVVPAVAAYAVLWIGGAIEILTYEDSSPGTSCIVATSISSTEVGEEQDRWIGGGLLWRPGVVCAVRAPSDTLETTDAAATPPTQAASPPAYRYEDRRLTQADVLSALFAALTVAIVAVVVEQRLARRR